MDELVAESLRTIERGSKSFAMAARLFDQRARDGAILLYAWCRHCDDVIDDQTLGFRSQRGSPRSAQQRLAALEDDTRRALSGEPTSETAFAALQEVVRRHEIPERHPLDLLRGFAMDVEGRSYESLEECCHYCYHVAGVVGVMMAYVMGRADEDTLDRAADLGIAFQMTNIARDVVEDAGIGRIYLPGLWLQGAGVPRHEVGLARQREAVSEVVLRLLDEAERYYASAQVGLARLPFRSAWAVATARRVYRDIGRLIRARGARAWDRRAGTSRPRKVFLSLVAAMDAASAAGGTPPATAASRAGLWTRARNGT